MALAGVHTAHAQALPGYGGGGFNNGGGSGGAASVSGPGVDGSPGTSPSGNTAGGGGGMGVGTGGLGGQGNNGAASGGTGGTVGYSGPSLPGTAVVGNSGTTPGYDGSGNGGGGGGGGFGAVILGTGPYTLTVNIGGAAGADGGGSIAGGGNGGGGGTALFFSNPGAPSLTVSTGISVIGGGGGSGGNAGVVGGSGAFGGYGIDFTSNASATLVNLGTIVGGNGGAAGTGGRVGSAGPGGVGVIGANLTVTNGGSISGGMSGDNLTQANAIEFTGGANTLTTNGGSYTGAIDISNASTGTLTLAQTAAAGATQSATYSNVFSGTGAVVVSTDTGYSVTLAAGNTYSGGTTVDSGSTLNLTNNAGAGTSGITLDAGSTLGLNAVAITNTVSGSGDPNINVTAASSMPTFTGLAGTTFNILGTDNNATTDVLTVTTANATYAGTTNVGGTAAGSSVTLTGGAENAFGAASAVSIFTGSVLDLGGNNQTIGSLAGGGTVTNSGASGTNTLSIGGGTATTFSGAITDGATALTALTLSNNGTSLTLTGTNTYTGGTTIGAGTSLQVGNGGTSGAITGNVTDNGVFAFDRSGTTTFTGNISGSGALQQNGGGTLILTNTETYNGPTNVNAGTLEVAGSIASSSLVTVANGAALTGAGTAGDVQVNSGATFIPGTAGSPGTAMSITGPLAFQSGALYVVSLNPSTSTSANVSGTATLTGATAKAQFASGSYLTKQYTILTASGGLGDTTFASLTSTNLPSGFADSLSYSGDDVFLNLTAVLGAAGTGGFNVNQQNVATALNTYFDNGGALSPNFINIFRLTGPGLGNALTQLDGEDATGAQTSAFQMMTQFLDLMLDPTAGGSGGTGGGATGFADEAQQNLPPDVALAYARALHQSPPPQQSFDQRWSAWGSGFGGSGTYDGNATAGSTNVTATDYGYAGGMDYHVTPDTVYGFALGGGGTNWNLATSLGSGRSDSFEAGVYAKTHWGAAYLSGALGFGNHWFTTNRIAVGDQLTASFQGQSYAARGEAGYRYVIPVTGYIIGLTPYAALQVQNFHTPGYNETDLTGGGLGLTYGAMKATDTRSELGARFDNLTVWEGMPLVLRGRLAWAHDWVGNPALGAVFQTLPGSSFTVNGAAVPQNSALTTAAAELHLTANWTAIAKFDGEFAPTAQTYAGTGTLRYSW